MDDTSSSYCDSCGAINPVQAMSCVACKQPLYALLPVGQLTPGSRIKGTLAAPHLLQQRYSIVGQVGTGGFGAVYKAEDTLFSNRPLAIKEVNQDGLSTRELAEAMSAFRHEILLLAGLNHPNLPRIYSQFSEGGRFFVVMDFIEGDTLEDYLDRVIPRLPVRDVLDIGIQLASVLDYLHSQPPPIIFRDVKPANIMRTPGGHVYLIDFGIARHFKPGKAKDTIPLGSKGYAAPEQYGKSQTTPQTDIYGLGATLHQLLTGDDPSLTPFSFGPVTLGKSLESKQLDALLARMLVMDASKRPESMRVVGQELHDLRAKLTARQVSHFQQSANKRIQRRSFLFKATRAIGVCAASAVAAGIVFNHLATVSQVIHPLDTSAPIAAVNMPTAAPAGNVVFLSRPLYTYRGHQGTVTAVAWSPAGQSIASAGALDETVRVWDAATGNSVLAYPSDPGVTGQHTNIPVFFTTGGQSVDALAWSPDGSYIAAALEDETVEVGSLKTGDIAFTLSSSPGNGNVLAYSPDGGSIATVSGTSSVQVWVVRTGQSVIYSGLTQAVSALAWSPDGSHIATGSRDGSIKVWAVATRRTLFTCSGHTQAVSAAAWSPDGKYIASSSADGSVRIWDAGTGQARFIYRGHAGAVNTVAWMAGYGYLPVMNPLDGTHAVNTVAWTAGHNYRLASGGADATVQVWSVRSAGSATHAGNGQAMTLSGPILVYRGHSDQVLAVSCAPDGRRIASGSSDGTVQVWQAG